MLSDFILLFYDVCCVHLHRAHLIMWNSSNHILCLWDRLIVERWSACGTLVMCLRLACNMLETLLALYLVCFPSAGKLLVIVCLQVLVVCFPNAEYLLLLLGIHLLSYCSAEMTAQAPSILPRAARRCAPRRSNYFYHCPLLHLVQDIF